MTVTLNPAIHKRLKARAVEEDVDIQDLANAIIDWALDDKTWLDELIDEEFPEDEDEEEAEE